MDISNTSYKVHILPSAKFFSQIYLVELHSLMAEEDVSIEFWKEASER